MPTILPNWHPVLVHFAIAPTLLAALLFLAGYVLASRGIGPALTTAARVNLVLGTGWYGGENVYRHGLGVQRLPDTGAHEHETHEPQH